GVEGGDVDRVADGAGGEEIGEEFDRFGGDGGLGLFGAGPQVRGADDTRHAKQGAIGAGFFFVNVECDPGQFASLESFDERLFVEDAPSGAVDEPRARLDLLELRHVE